VSFVADVRARSDRLARELDPDVAERVINAELTSGKRSITMASLTIR
jgi:hypothetical protein